MNPRSEWFKRNTQSESIRRIPTSDSLGLKDWSGFIRIHSLGLTRIETDWFLTELHQTRLKNFFGLTRMSSDWRGNRFRNESEWIWLARNEFQSETFTRVVPCHQRKQPWKYSKGNACYWSMTNVLALIPSFFSPCKILLRQLSDIETWLDKWGIKANETKSVHITFTTRKENCSTVNLYDRPLPGVNEVKYLGIYLDRALTWPKHIKTKRKAMDLNLRKMYWLVGRKSQLSSYNEPIIYKVIIKPVWTYGI